MPLDGADACTYIFLLSILLAFVAVPLKVVAVTVPVKVGLFSTATVPLVLASGDVKI
jgi:hypothetical protein